MGLTLNCAQCHTHKYDPVLHTDYFSVMALLNNADEPTYHIPTPDLEARQADHARRLRVAEETLEGKFPGGPAAVEKRFGEWLDAQSPRASRWKILRPAKIKTTLPHLDVQPDGFILGGGDITKSDVYDLAFDRAVKGAVAIRLEVASHPRCPTTGPASRTTKARWAASSSASSRLGKETAAWASATRPRRTTRKRTGSATPRPPRSRRPRRRPPRPRRAARRTTRPPRSTARCPAAGRC
jgi:hypothetical protein